MKKSSQEFELFLLSLWNEYAGKPEGIEKYKKQVQAFMPEMQRKTRFNIILCIFEPYFLSNYVSFRSLKRRTIKNFWKFSNVLWEIHTAYKAGKREESDWKNWKKEYFDTMKQLDEIALLIVKNEILKLTLTPP